MTMSTSDTDAEQLLRLTLVELIDEGKPSENLYFPFVSRHEGKPRAGIVIVGDPFTDSVRAVVKALQGYFETITINVVLPEHKTTIQDAYERGGNGGAFERSWDYGIATVRG